MLLTKIKSMVFAAKCIVVLFGFFFFCSGFLMLFTPEKAREILRKAGSTNVINYAEITIRMIPATALIICSEYSRFPEVFRIFGWFMLMTSVVLYFVPRQIHHNFSLKSAEILKPIYFQLIAPFAFIIGCFLIYAIM